MEGMQLSGRALASHARCPGFNPRCLQTWFYLIFSCYLQMASYKDHASLAQWQSTSLVNWGSWVQTPQEAIFKLLSKLLSKTGRSWQGSNLRGQSPLDFKSNALTTRPQLLRYINEQKVAWRCGGLNPGPFTCKANALPLSYIPQSWISQDLVGSPLST